MNRLISLLIAAGGVVVFPLVDSAIKGTIVLLLAGTVCLVLRRDSAATRHMVWSMAVCLLIAMPVLSLVLPEWRVLPSWINSDEPAVATSSPTTVVAMDSPSAVAEMAESSISTPFPGQYFPADESVEMPTTQPNIESDSSESVASAGYVAASPSALSWTTWLSGIWFFGCVVLVARLLAAAVLLRRSARRSMIVTLDSGERLGVSPPCSSQINNCPTLQRVDSDPHPRLARCGLQNADAKSTRRADAQPLAIADAQLQRLQTALIQATALLGVKKPIQLLIDPQRSIPIVWGLLKTRLQLPVEAVQWTDEQLQSVLLHELAHVRRKDLFILAITQVACALHWFNPLVWIAAWRMHVERERACDDLVLASGVRASAYAEHLLDVATRLSSSKWTQACGLAMSRSSSLHGRLTAVLSEKQNRRSVSTTVLAAAMMICTAVVVPVAMLCADAETASSKAETVVSESPKAIQDDSLPELQRPDLSTVTTAKKAGSSDESNVEISVKWSAHLDAAIAALRSGGSIDVARNHGMPLPEFLRDAPWGASDSDGLRLALMVDTSTATETNTELIGRNFVRRRLLVHNSGDHLVEFVATNIHHRFGEGEYSCVSFSSTNTTIITHLAPDAYVEFYMPSVLWEFSMASMRYEPGIDEFPLCVRRGKNGVAMVADLCLIKAVKEETRDGASLKRLTLKSKKEHIDVALTRSQIRKNIKFADSPGDYVLSRNVKLTIKASVDSPSEIVARVVFNDKIQGVDSAGRSMDIKLDEPYRFGWEVGTGIVWLATKSGSQRIDYSIPEVSNQLAIEPFDPKYLPASVSYSLNKFIKGETSPNASQSDRAVDTQVASNISVRHAESNSSVATDGPNAKNDESTVQQGSNKLQIADRSGTYDLGKGRTLKIDASGIDKQWFEIRWSESGDWKKSRLRIPISMSETEVATLRMQPGTQLANVAPDERKNSDKALEQRLVITEPTFGWKIVWNENSDDLWFECSRQAAVVTRLTTANPAQVTATHYFRSLLPPFIESRDVPYALRIRQPVSKQGLFGVVTSFLVPPPNEEADELDLAAESSADWNVIASETDADGKPSRNVAVPVKTVVSPTITFIRGYLLKPDGTPAAGYMISAEDGVDRLKYRSSRIPALPQSAMTAEDGSFKIVLRRHLPLSIFLWAAKEKRKISEEFAPLEVSVPANGDVGHIRFSKGRTVTGKVVGLDGKGLANVRVSCVRQNPRVQGLYSLICNRTATTGDDGAFTLPPLGAGDYLLKIETHSLGDDELSIAFANQRINSSDTEPLHLEGQAVKGNLLLAKQNHEPIEVDFRPLKTVNITLDVTVNRSNPKFNDFEVRISGRLPGMTSADPASFWTRPGRATLTQGHFTIAVPEGLTRASINAAPVYMRIGDKPEFIWQRPNDATPKNIDQLELGTVSEPLGLALTVKDAAE